MITEKLLCALLKKEDAKKKELELIDSKKNHYNFN